MAVRVVAGLILAEVPAGPIGGDVPMPGLVVDGDGHLRVRGPEIVHRRFAGHVQLVASPTPTTATDETRVLVPVLGRGRGRAVISDSRLVGVATGTGILGDFDDGRRLAFCLPWSSVVSISFERDARWPVTLLSGAEPAAVRLRVEPDAEGTNRDVFEATVEAAARHHLTRATTVARRAHLRSVVDDPLPELDGETVVDLVPTS